MQRRARPRRYASRTTPTSARWPRSSGAPGAAARTSSTSRSPPASAPASSSTAASTTARRHRRRDRPHDDRRDRPGLPLRQPRLPRDVRRRRGRPRAAAPPPRRRLTLRQVVALAEAGDPGCQRVIADAGRALGRAVAGACNLLAPEHVVIGGELAQAGDLLLEPIRAPSRRSAIAAAREIPVPRRRPRRARRGPRRRRARAARVAALRRPLPRASSRPPPASAARAARLRRSGRAPRCAPRSSPSGCGSSGTASCQVLQPVVAVVAVDVVQREGQADSPSHSSIPQRSQRGLLQAPRPAAAA